MNIKDLKRSLEYLFKAEITPFIWGHAGIGKSTVVKQYAQSKGYKFFPFYLGTQSDLGDILGLASFVKDKNGSEIATTFATPLWLKDTIDYCNENPESGAVIFLDEFNRARRDILNGMFSLALDKTFHTLKLPKNCHIVAAGNPPTDEYFTTDVNETALMARFAHIKLEPSFQEWVTYAKDAQFESSLVTFLQEQPELLEDGKSAFTLPVKVDRRSYERVNRLFKVGTPEDVLEQLMVGIIGAERLVAYKLHLKSKDKALTYEQVMEGSGLMLLKEWSNPSDIKASLLSVTCDNIFTSMKANASEVLAADQSENFMQFLEILPKDSAYPLLVRLFKEDIKIFSAHVKNPVFEERLTQICLDAGIGNKSKTSKKK
jgi:MoxR-like ATPase